MNRSLNIRINALVLMIVLSFTIIIFIFWYTGKKTHELQLLETSIESVVERLSQSLIRPIWDIDDAVLSHTIVAEMQNKNIVSVAVYHDSTTNILMGKTRDPLWNIIPLHTPLPNKVNQKEAEVRLKNAIIGTVVVRYTDKYILETINNSVVNQLKVLILLGIVFLTALSITIYFSVIRPIKNLAHTIRESTGSNKNIEIATTRNDEIGDLAQSFSQMRESIQDKITNLNKEIVERTQIENKLKASEEKYRTFFESSKDAILLMETGATHNDLEQSTKIIDCNAAALEMFKALSKKEFLSYTIIDLSPKLQDGMVCSDIRANEVINTVLSTGYNYFEWTHMRLDGTEFPATVAASKVEMGGHVLLQATIRDVGEFKKTKEALKESDEIYRTIFERSDNAIFMLDPKTGKYLDANKAAETLTGRSVAELEKMTTHDVSPQKAKERLMQTVTTNIPHDMGEVQYIQPDGSFKTALVSTIPVHENLIIGIARDITERKSAQELLVQNEKMLSVGGLAAGMAHEINNPLGGMIQNAINLENRLTNISIPANIKVAEQLNLSLPLLKQYIEQRGILHMTESIKEAGNRAAHIVKNMLSFARKTENEFLIHDMTSILDSTIFLASTDYDIKKSYDFKSITIVKEYDTHVPPVGCEAVKVQQVFLNILRNGAEAMCTIDVEKSSPPPPETPRFILRLKHDVAHKMVQIEIEDNGPGMSEEIRKRIFEPFFTTKPVGVGTGLGLSVSYFIISENHNGEMFAESIEGAGTKFIIRLPVEHK
ncbi:MAG: PAS domain S-box protein [Reichenbachiella sp.]